jgi:hypothetical protein
MTMAQFFITIRLHSHVTDNQQLCPKLKQELDSEEALVQLIHIRSIVYTSALHRRLLSQLYKLFQQLQQQLLVLHHFKLQ